jgi:cyanophycinase
MEEVDRELLAGRPPVLAFLPTAAGEEGPRRVEYWLRLGSEHARRLGVEPVPLLVVDRADAERADLADRLAGAGLVYLSGGRPGYLADTLRDTPVLQAILAAWQAGAALAGCSAGAAALSEVAYDLPAGLARPGLGLLGGLVVLPHFDRLEQLAPALIERSVASLVDGQVLVGIDEETALVGGPHSWRVRGRGRVWLIDAEGRRDFLSCRHPTPP